MDRVLKNPTKNLKHVAHARDGMISLKDMGITDLEMIKLSLRQGFEYALEVCSYDGELTESEIETADQLLKKYMEHDWTYRMDIKRAVRKRGCMG